MTETGAIQVDRSGFHAALEALMMDDPHPKGYISNSPAARLDRALWAYEWARSEFPVTKRPDGRWSQQLPPIGVARSAVLEKEARDE
ncbi:hypothetical protein [Nocardia flavorosea]|uniref:Uncharacterized protein n=1 Tax=Nocardia flavorosea TaxID=53429 RepID=A0A846YSY2_9NOCA|nr:hypothetical protein [Nocardia flavorosea]NKY60781.1 hypothetical protein [Nocardia flavorosea]